MVVVGAAVALTAVAALPVVAGAAVGSATGAGATVTATVSASGAATVTATAGSGAGASATAAVVSASALGPVGWFTLGAESCTFDCWKAVLRDDSAEPSAGMLLREVAVDSRIKRVVMDPDAPLPGIVLHNVWDERFLVEYVTLPSKQIALHASRLK